MDTRKMISEIKTACTKLESEKNGLLARVKEIEDDLTAYRMAFESLELTVRSAEKVTEVPKTDEPVKAQVSSKARNRGGYWHFIEYNGKSQSITDWAKETGINVKTLGYRLRKGWPIAEALRPDSTYTVRKTRKAAKKAQKIFAYDMHGNTLRQYMGFADASKDLNLPASTIQKIIENVTKEDQLKARNYYLSYAL